MVRFDDWRWSTLLLYWRPSGRRKRGRPIRRWEEVLEKFAVKWFDGRRWTEVAQNRLDWKQWEKVFLRCNEREEREGCFYLLLLIAPAS